MLRSKIKRYILLSSLILLTGCEATYTITIDNNNINEKIEVLDKVSDIRSVTDVMSGYKRKYPVYNIDGILDEDDLYATYPEGIYYNQT